MDKGSTQTLNVVLCLEAESVLVVPESLELDTAEEIIPPSSAQTGVYGVEVWTRIFFAGMFGPPDPDPVIFSTDPDPDTTCNNGFIKLFLS